MLKKVFNPDKISFCLSDFCFKFMNSFLDQFSLVKEIENNLRWNWCISNQITRDIALVMLFIASLILFFFSSQNILHWNAQPVINETCALVSILIHWHQAISNVQLIDNSHKSIAAQKAAIEKNRQVKFSLGKGSKKN